MTSARRTFQLLGRLLALALLAAMAMASFARADFQITGFDGSSDNRDGSASTQAGAHPFAVTTKFSISAGTDSSGNLVPDENPRDLQILLPAGLVGNPTAAPKCTQAQLADSPLVAPYNRCPIDSQVGFAEIDFTLGGPEATLLKLPVYNMETPVGSPALFGFNVVVYPTYVHARIRTGGDYGVTAEMSPISQATPFVGGLFTLWGVPADSAHDADRGVVCFGGSCLSSGVGSTAPRKPFLTNPMNCSAGPLTSFLRVDSWLNIGRFEEDSFVSHLPDGAPAGVDGCSRLAFDPSIHVSSSASRADSPMGLSVQLALPQNEAADGLAEAYLKKAAVTLPSGVRINPAAGDGLAGCTSAQLDLRGTGPARCPDASKVGSVAVATPLLDHPLTGSVYVGAQKDNPFGSLLATYISVEDPQTGVVIKLAGRVEADPDSGQLTAVFDQNPQLPFSSLDLNLYGGSRAVLRAPSTCGAHATTARFSAWSAADPDHPTPAETVTSVDTFTIDRGPDGGACRGQSFDPVLSAGTFNPVAGRYSPASLRVAREDGSQELGSLAVTLPEGLLAKLAGIPYCPEAAINSALGRRGEGLGAVELAAPSCPAASLLGTVSVGAGAGPSPLYVNTGRVYLAGPYRSAPLSLLVVAPALAGPFDLGAVVVRTALKVDPLTARVEAVSDPIPAILAGIPLDLRDLRVIFDHPGFIINPTSCERMSFSGSAVSAAGATAPLSDRFQVGSCERLGFAPRLALSLKGGTRRGGHPSLRAVVHYPSKGANANLRFARVALPHSAFLDQSHIRTVCTRVQFAAKRCPHGSIYGRARAISPLLDRPLEGPVYLRSSNNPLPDLVVALEGPESQPIEVDLIGRIDSIGGGLRTTFAKLPDVPITSFALRMQGGKKGLLVNSVNLCAGRGDRAAVRLTAQSGRALSLRPALRSSCKEAAHRKRGRGPKA